MRRCMTMHVIGIHTTAQPFRKYHGDKLFTLMSQLRDKTPWWASQSLSFFVITSAISKQVPEEKQHEAAAPHARKFDGWN